MKNSTGFCLWYQPARQAIVLAEMGNFPLECRPSKLQLAVTRGILAPGEIVSAE